MLVYPQLDNGALSQFPVTRRRQLRTVVNRAADGRTVKLAQPTAGTTEWRLEYAALSEKEIGRLEQFFVAAEGTLNEFTFADPMANLLAWSGDLRNAVWQCEPLLARAAGVDDPEGAHDAWRLTNAGAGPQSVSQTLAAPGEYVYCFSVYVRAAQTTTVKLTAGEKRAERMADGAWTRAMFSTSGKAGADSVTFGIEIPAGAAVDVYGMQVEAQAAPSAYQATTRGGVYEGARLRDDALVVTATDVNRNTCTVNIIHADHL